MKFYYMIFCVMILYKSMATFVRSHSYNEDNCRNIKFFGHIEGQALVDHVISSLLVTSGDICQIRCYFVHDCVSFNLGISETGDLYICELNNSTDQAFLQKRKKYTYHETQNSCSSRPCLNNGKCQHGFTAKTFRCLCPAGFEGELCEKDIDECQEKRCGTNATCNNTEGSFKCTCNFGYYGDGYNCTECYTIFDFEDHDLSNWTFNGTAFNNQPTYGNNTLSREDRSWSKHKGDWWIGTFENRSSPSEPFGGEQTDVPQGSLTSPSFQITGKLLTFLIGSGCDESFPNLRAELIIGGEVVRNKTTKACDEAMKEESWNVTGYAGKNAQLRLVDNSSAGWGHINFDHLQACHKLIADPDS